VLRVETIRAEPVPLPRRPLWLDSRPPADLWVVTSRAVVDTFLRAQPDWIPPLRTIPDVIAVGSDTRHALETCGFGPIRTAARGGSRDLLAVMGPVRGRRVLYLRSDRAGTLLADELRQRGGQVIDRVVYRVRERRALRSEERRRLGTVPIWAVSSPSALEAFRRLLGPVVFDARIRDVRLFALGARTAHALRTAGARRVNVPNRSTEEGFTKLLEKALGDGFPRTPRPTG
jgi:uroporphyrinogen-III synthase